MFITKQVRSDLITLVSDNLNHWKDYLEEGEGEEESFLNLTVGLNKEGNEWTFQTGDNSFSGSCYHSPHWSVVSFGMETTKEELLTDLFLEIDLIEIGEV